MSALHFLEPFPLLRIEMRNHFLMGLAESRSDPLTGFLANDVELRRSPVNDRRDLRRLFRREPQLALDVRAHALPSVGGMSPHEDKVGMPGTGKKSRRHASDEDDDQRDRQLPFPTLHHGHVPASIAVSAIA